MHGRRPAVGLAEYVGDPGPELAGRTEFRDRHELVVVGHQPEADLAQRVGDLDARVDQRTHVLHGRSQRAGELPGRVGAAVVERRSVNRDRANPGTAGEVRGDPGDLLELRCAETAERRGERIGTQIDRQSGFPGRFAPARRSGALGVVGAGHQRQHRLGGGTELRPGVEDHRSEFDEHSLEQPVQIRCGDTGVTDPQHQGADALAQGAQHRGIAVGDLAGEAGPREHLGDLPAGDDVAAGIAAADERPCARQRRLGQLVQCGVERPDRKALVGGRVQQRLGLGGQIRGIFPAALGQHAGHRGAPAGAAFLNLY